MYLTCPHCGTVYTVRAAMLKEGQGEVRCGACRTLFNALDHLSDDLPEQTLSDEPAKATGPKDPAPGDALRAEPAYGRPEELDYEAPEEPAYGRPEAPGYEAPEEPAYGRPEEPAYGRPEAPGYEAPEEPAYGRPEAPGYEAPEEPAYGRPEELDYEAPEEPAYGRPEAPGYEAPEEPAYGRPEAPGYEAPEAPAYGRPEAPVSGSAAEPMEQPSAPHVAADVAVPPALSADWQAMQRNAAAPRRNLGMLLLSVLLLIALAAQYVWFEPRDLVMRYPQTASVVDRFCRFAGCIVPARRDPARIQMLARDVRAHPRFEGALLVSATFSNAAPWSQPFPRLRFRLYDVNGETIASRIFQPGEYLAGTLSTDAELPPAQPLQIALELLAPEEAAVSFEFSFL